MQKWLKIIYAILIIVEVGYVFLLGMMDGGIQIDITPYVHMDFESETVISNTPILSWIEKTPHFSLRSAQDDIYDEVNLLYDSFPLDWLFPEQSILIRVNRHSGKSVLVISDD